MFDLSNDVTILKTRIRLLEIRKKRILDASRADDGNSLYWAQSDLLRIETEIREAERQLTEKTGEAMNLEERPAASQNSWKG
jgi:hypothetical protein